MTAAPAPGQGRPRSTSARPDPVRSAGRRRLIAGLLSAALLACAPPPSRPTGDGPTGDGPVDEKPPSTVGEAPPDAAPSSGEQPPPAAAAGGASSRADGPAAPESSSTGPRSTPSSVTPTRRPEPTIASRPPAISLTRGVNIDRWFLERPFVDEVSLDELRRLRAFGLTFLRLPLEPELFLGSDGLTSEVKSLDRLLDRAAEAGLAVVVDVHPNELSKRRIVAGEAGPRARLRRIVELLAAHLAARDRATVALEPLNEPHDVAGGWPPLQGQLVAAARGAAPDLTLILTGDDWGSSAGLLRTPPIADRNVIYTFHFYDPHVFTHQGATWGGPTTLWAHMAGVPYPLTPETLAAAWPAMAARLADDDLRRQVRAELERRAAVRWDRARLALEIERVAEWSRRNSAVVFCGELGVYRPRAAAADRLRWLRDVRELLESQRLGWALWEYHQGFGLVDPGTRTPDRPMLAALGLVDG